MRDGVVFNPKRHKHELCFTGLLPDYECSGCKGWGTNTGYKCGSCPEFVLHENCAASPDEYDHPFFSRDPFKFRDTALLPHQCNACGMSIRGFLFESSGGFRVHPLCLMSPLHFTHSGHPDHELQLTTNQERGKYSCTQCRKEHKKWKYRCGIVKCDVEMDMNCVMVDFHGLRQHDINHVYKPSGTKRVLKKVAEAGQYVGATVANAVFTVLVGEVSNALANRGTGSHDEEGGSDHGGKGRNGR